MASLTRIVLASLRQGYGSARRSALRAKAARRLRSERGAELLEFAFVLPVMMLVLAGILDMGFLFKNYEVVTNAAREGARMAALPGRVDADVRSRVNAYLAVGGLTGTATTTINDVVLNIAPGVSIDGVRVVVSYPHSFMVLGPSSALVQPTAISNSATLTAVVTMRTEKAAGL